MGKETVLFSSEEKTDTQRVAAFLHQLADKILEGELRLKQGDEEIVTEIPKRLVLEVKLEDEAKKQRVKRGLEIELEWYVGESDPGGISLG